MVHYDEITKTFHLKTKDASYVFCVGKAGHLQHLYFGARIEGTLNADQLAPSWPMAPGNQTMYSEDHSTLSLNLIGLEMATYGKGDYREPTIHMESDEGYRTFDFIYQSHDILHKYHFEGMPQSHKQETLQVTLFDAHHEVTCKLNYSLDHTTNTIIRNLEVINGQATNLTLDKCLSMNLDFPDADFDVVTYHGAWLRERHEHSHRLGPGVYKIDSKKGSSSNDHNPFIALKRHDAGETLGEVYGVTLVYSGNFEANIECSPHRLTRLNMGINSFDFKWRLAPKERFVTPEVWLTYSNQGLNGLSQHVHRFASTHLLEPQKERPIMFNNWEATYFDFKEATLLKLARQAKRLGMEGFCVDDGWFGRRDDDRSSLGDWWSHPKKHPKGIAHFAKKIKKMGLLFGLWVEPEMISENSDLYKAHPDWVMHYPKGSIALGRHQWVLDLSKDEVVDYLYNTLSHLFKEADVDYVKWDMNRHFSDLFSRGAKPIDQGKLAHRYVLGLYQLLHRLKETFKDVLFESCSSGGNRFDYGMHAFMPQAWTSDNTDAYERLKIQQGTLRAYPLSTLSNHVSASPSHQVIRQTPIDTRFNVACFGVLGYELDLRRLSPFDRKQIKRQTAFYKRHRTLLQFGTLYQSKRDHDWLFWIVNDAQTEALWGLFKGLNTPNPPIEYVSIDGLKPSANYHVTAREQAENLRRFGDLVKHALPIPLKAHGTLFNQLANHVLFKTETEDIILSGSQIKHPGIRLKTPFMGSGYHEALRVMPDFASRLYNIREVNDGQSSNDST